MRHVQVEPAETVTAKGLFFALCIDDGSFLLFLSLEKLETPPSFCHFCRALGKQPTVTQLPCFLCSGLQHQIPGTFRLLLCHLLLLNGLSLMGCGLLVARRCHQFQPVSRRISKIHWQKNAKDLLWDSLRSKNGRSWPQQPWWILGIEMSSCRE